MVIVFLSLIYGQGTSEGFILVLQRLPEQIKEKNEKMKEEMIGNQLDKNHEN